MENYPEIQEWFDATHWEWGRTAYRDIWDLRRIATNQKNYRLQLVAMKLLENWKRPEPTLEGACNDVWNEIKDAGCDSVSAYLHTLRERGATSGVN